MKKLIALMMAALMARRGRAAAILESLPPEMPMTALHPFPFLSK